MAGETQAAPDAQRLQRRAIAAALIGCVILVGVLIWQVYSKRMTRSA
jgi:hypothetical protein